ncbi:MAG: dihydroorotate dehydrogenase electron transfer subunit [Thermoplasmata archaeon]|nr:MAG: dihydroorotate dehydrogenase electron transfer subunit [Thermoplasmata archaeon]
MREVVEVLENNRVAKNVHTIRFRWKRDARPGQFVMVWIPGSGEVPLSLSYVGDIKGITVKVVGETTEKIARLKTGERFGIRGPYGNSYSYANKILVIAGGTGMCSLAPAIEMARVNYKVAFIKVFFGAKSAEDLFMLDRIEKFADALVIATEDGSLGKKGLITDFALPEIKKGFYDIVWTCGPEAMMIPIVKKCLAEGVNVEASLERYMKCAIGVCGSCAIGRFLVCKDGPVFDTKILSEIINGLGKVRSPSGRLIDYAEQS